MIVLILEVVKLVFVDAVGEVVKVIVAHWVKVKERVRGKNGMAD